MKLLIVESPTKAKTIARFLPHEFTVLSSFGHVRDLPKTKMGVDTEHDFAPTYVLMRGKKEQITKLKAAAKKAEEIYFATDHDREGEAISWHLAHILGVKDDDVKRIVFHEITKPSIVHALAHAGHLNIDLVNAQQARRVLDRLVGYELSPFLWSKVARGLSAGRVQSVALRVIVEREREIRAFTPQEYWTIEGIFTSRGNETLPAPAQLFAIDDNKLDKFAVSDASAAHTIAQQVEGIPGTVKSIARKRVLRRPAPPFITSTLQQESNHKLGFSAKQTMMIAQQLYEGVDIKGEGSTGLITYMRTDSVTLSQLFIDAARHFIAQAHGPQYLPDTPRVFSSSTKNAQEAHEAIRPTDVTRTPDALKNNLTGQQWKLYDLIWRRSVATQMVPATMAHTTVDIAVNGKDNKTYIFRATGSTISFEGFLVVYPELKKDTLLPELKEHEALSNTAITPTQHFTEPPARFSDATLVKALEQFGIGRPSTYAPTIATLEERDYVTRDERKKFVPTDIGEVVTDLLATHFPQIVDTEFTARMEDDLDKVAQGDKQWQRICKEFYGPFKKLLEEKKIEVKRSEVMSEKTDRLCPQCGKEIVIRTGRYGKFYACSGYPECKFTEPLEKKEKRAPQPTGVACPQCGGMIVARATRRGKLFYGCGNYPT